MGGDVWTQFHGERGENPRNNSQIMCPTVTFCNEIIVWSIPQPSNRVGGKNGSSPRARRLVVRHTGLGRYGARTRLKPLINSWGVWATALLLCLVKVICLLIKLFFVHFSGPFFNVVVTQINLNNFSQKTFYCFQCLELPPSRHRRFPAFGKKSRNLVAGGLLAIDYWLLSLVLQGSKCSCWLLQPKV